MKNIKVTFEFATQNDVVNFWNEYRNGQRYYQRCYEFLNRMKDSYASVANTFADRAGELQAAYEDVEGLFKSIFKMED